MSERTDYLARHFASAFPGLRVPQSVLDIDAPHLTRSTLKRMKPEKRASITATVAKAAAELTQANRPDLSREALMYVLRRVFRVSGPFIAELLESEPSKEPMPVAVAPMPVVLAVLSYDELEIIADVVWNKIHDMRLWDGRVPDSLVRASAYLSWLQASTQVPRSATTETADASEHHDAPDQLLALPSPQQRVAETPAPYRLFSRPNAGAPLPPGAGCQFPLWGDVRQFEGHQHCGAQRREGSSYCDEHHRVCLVDAPKRRPAGHGGRGLSLN